MDRVERKMKDGSTLVDRGVGKMLEVRLIRDITKGGENRWETVNATAKECAIKTRPRRWIVRASEERRVRGGERKNGLSPWCTIYTRVHESLKIRRDAMQFISDDHSSNKQLARNRLRAINRYLLESFLTTNDDFVIFFFLLLFFFFSISKLSFSSCAVGNRDIRPLLLYASKRSSYRVAKDDSICVSCQFFFFFFEKEYERICIRVCTIGKNVHENTYAICNDCKKYGAWSFFFEKKVFGPRKKLVTLMSFYFFPRLIGKERRKEEYETKRRINYELIGRERRASVVKKIFKLLLVSRWMKSKLDQRPSRRLATTAT